ncbi:unnamed protein product [Effrenium voratum]|uniref:Uncharacterized protein n=1 Tax=Effrenium voratum TaxID=2562239 RepID=A0AA36IJV2_9DINO|nr:unnamed protein product [Effrenium voratum]CAJ1454611.1 unnamed protein product [Effrenium voratum]
MAGCVCILTVLHCLLLAFAKDTCSSPASPVTLEAPKTVQQGQGSSAWSFVPASQDIEVVVTPSNSSEDPDLRLYAASGTACKPVLTSQEIGGEYMRIARELTKEWNVSKYYLHVMCRREVDCKYHLAFSKAEGEWQEIGDGEERSGVAYHGVPSHFKFSCGEPCARALDAGQSDRVTFSAWPRDATSTKHLTLLVRFGQPPTTHVDEHLNATRGWFSGEVVNGGIQRGDFFITVLKRHGLSPLPFVVSVKLPSSVQLLKLGKPTFGSVNQHSMSFYKFFVDQADTDIEVYLTKLDGDPDCSLAHEEVNPRPSRLAFQWHSGAPGDDEITVPPDDPKRRQHTTGWFHVGVQSFEDATFSIIAFVEKHINASSDINQGKDGYVVQWTELWLGLPQAMAAQPGRPANFLFYSQLATSKLFVTVEALEGDKPDACVHKCGADPHRCPWLPIYLGETTRAKVPVKAVSFCREGELRGHSSDEQVVISKPCTNCWYAILVTTESNRSRFKIQLGAAGRAHPLVDGEAFKGSVDGGDACSLFVYDLSRSVAETRARTNATLQLSLTRIYGNPVFDVRKGSEDGQLLFSSSAFGDDSWSLALDSVGKVTQLSDTYYINVCASGRQHAQFRIQASWDQPLPSFDGGNALKLGFGMLRDGEAQSGSIFAGKRNIYLFVPATAEAKPSIRVSITSMSGDCSLFILAPREGDNAKEKIREFISNPIATADWKEVERSQPTILIAPSDAKYLPPTAALYIILVTAPGKDTVQYEITAAAGGLEELPTTGLPIRGQVKAKEYRRYRLVVAEADEHVSVQLAADVGDCDLYVGRTADVSSNNYDWRSEAFGSDWIFINGLGELNQKHCDNKTISEKNECVYFVAVKGVSTESDFTLQAIVPSAMVPLPLLETQIAL